MGKEENEREERREGCVVTGDGTGADKGGG